MSDLHDVTPIVTSARLAIDTAMGLPDLPRLVRDEHVRLARERLDDVTLYQGRLGVLGLPPPPSTWRGNEALMWPHELGHVLLSLVAAAREVLEAALAVPPLPARGARASRQAAARDAALAKLLAAGDTAEVLLKRVRAMLRDLEAQPPRPPAPAADPEPRPLNANGEEILLYLLQQWPVLKKEPDITAAVIQARGCSVDRSTISRCLGLLEDDGLVRREGERKGRILTVPRGKELAERLHARRSAGPDAR
jgi:hypothetical protein